MARFRALLPERLLPFLLLTFCILLAGGATEPAAASPVTFSFTGNVSFLDAELSGVFNTTQTLSGSYTFESTAADLFPGVPNLGFYFLTALSTTVGSYTASVGGGFVPAGLRVLDAFQFPNQLPLDGYSLESQLTGLGLPGAAGFPVDSFIFRLSDRFDLTFINTDALPLSPPDILGLSAVNRTWNLVFRGGPSGVVVVGGPITSLTVSGVVPVPEPGTLALLSLGVLGIARRGRVRQRLEGDDPS